MERDTLALLELDAPDTVETRDSLRTYARDVLLNRFRQKAIYLKLVADEEVGSDP